MLSDSKIEIRHCARPSLCPLFFLLIAIFFLVGAAWHPNALAQRSQESIPEKLARLTEMIQSPDEGDRLAAVSEIGGPHNPLTYPLLLDALKDSSATVRRTAAWSLVGAKDPSAIEALRPLLEDENDRVRAAATWALSHIGGSKVTADISERARKDPSGLVRFRAVWGLAFIKDKSALPVAVEALADPNNSVRERAALIALEALNDGSIPQRILPMRQHPHIGTRRLVMYLLGRYGNATVIPALCESLQDRDATVRAEAALALGKLKAQSAVGDLTNLFFETDEHVRGASAYAVGLIGDRSAVPSLRRLLDDPHAFVRAVAAESLERLGEKDIKPPEGFKAREMFTFPLHSPEHQQLYR